SRDRVRAAEVAVKHARFPAPPGVVVERERGHVEGLAVETERRDELTLVHPAFDASRNARLVPLGAALEELDALAALGDVEDRITLAGPAAELDVRLGDHDLGDALCAGRRGREEDDDQHACEMTDDGHHISGTANGSL